MQITRYETDIDATIYRRKKSEIRFSHCSTTNRYRFIVAFLIVIICIGRKAAPIGRLQIQRYTARGYCAPHTDERAVSLNEDSKLHPTIHFRPTHSSLGPASHERANVSFALCKLRGSERTNERASERRLWFLPALSHPFTDYGAVAKNVRLAVTVCWQNLPFRLAFSTCENKSLSRFSYRSGKRLWEWGGGVRW